MRYSRMFFSLPLACALAAALAFFTPHSLRFDYGERISAASWQMTDFSVFDVMAPADAIIAERSMLDKPADAHFAVYIRANQPMTAWRTAVDSYSHIDPHIQAA